MGYYARVGKRQAERGGQAPACQPPAPRVKKKGRGGLVTNIDTCAPFRYPLSGRIFANGRTNILPTCASRQTGGKRLAFCQSMAATLPEISLSGSKSRTTMTTSRRT